MFKPFIDLPGGFSTNDGTIDFYLRIRTLVNKNKKVVDLGAGEGRWFNDKKKIKTSKLKNAIFISMGGSDKYDITSRIIKPLKKTKLDFSAFIIINLLLFFDIFL